MALDHQDRQVQEVSGVFPVNLEVLDKMEILGLEVFLGEVEYQDLKVYLVSRVLRVQWVREDSQVLEYRVHQDHQDLMDEVYHLVTIS